MVTSAKPAPVVATGEIEIEADPGTITSTIRRLDRTRQIVWTGRTLGIDAVHVWKSEGENGRTVVSSEETISGFPAGFFRRSLEIGLKWLKETVEGRMR